MKKAGILIAVFLLATIVLLGCAQKPQQNQNNPNSGNETPGASAGTPASSGQTLGAATGISESDLGVGSPVSDEMPDTASDIPGEPAE